jgi:hypothetical protein
MTAAERLSELALILAAGLIRLSPPQSSEKPAETGESSLDFSAKQSGVGPNRNGEFKYVR